MAEDVDKQMGASNSFRSPCPAPTRQIQPSSRTLAMSLEAPGRPRRMAGGVGEVWGTCVVVRMATVVIEEGAECRGITYHIERGVTCLDDFC